MTDREKVIKGLECCQLDVNKCLDCPYLDKQNKVAECGIELHRDAIALLKAQEPVKPKYDPDDDDWAHCGHCGARLYERWVGANYCAFCGHEVKWDD